MLAFTSKVGCSKYSVCITIPSLLLSALLRKLRLSTLKCSRLCRGTAWGSAAAVTKPQRLQGVDAKAFVERLRTLDLSPSAISLPHTRELKDVCWGTLPNPVQDRVLYVFQASSNISSTRTHSSSAVLSWPRHRPPSRISLLTSRVQVQPWPEQSREVDVLRGNTALLYTGMPSWVWYSCLRGTG